MQSAFWSKLLKIPTRSKSPYQLKNLLSMWPIKFSIFIRNKKIRATWPLGDWEESASSAATGLLKFINLQLSTSKCWFARTCPKLGRVRTWIDGNDPQHTMRHIFETYYAPIKFRASATNSYSDGRIEIIILIMQIIRRSNFRILEMPFGYTRSRNAHESQLGGKGRNIPMRDSLHINLVLLYNNSLWRIAARLFSPHSKLDAKLFS